MMNNKKGFLISVSLIGLLCNSLSFAGNMPGETTATIAGAYYHFNHRRDMEHTVMPNVALSYNFTEHWAIEGAIGVINTDSHDENNFDDDFDGNDKKRIHGMLYTIDGIYRFTPCNRFEPYVIAGIGVLGLKPNGDDTVQSGVVNAGLGTQFFLSRSIALRGEIKDVYTTTGSYKNDYMANVGVSFLFGGHKAVVYKDDVIPTTY